MLANVLDIVLSSKSIDLTTLSAIYDIMTQTLMIIMITVKILYSQRLRNT